ncbi:MAG: SAM-dependent methyltransferase [Actinomycetaceae bacterium]|nr:SAM-dependent methyltransferase [Actinomycetaceae bacterium]
MRCHHWDDGTCTSCSWLPLPYTDQVARKVDHIRSLLDEGASPHSIRWLDPATSPDEGFRTHVKLVVGGTPRRPTLGALGADRRGVDLPDCRIQHPAINRATPPLKRLIRALRLQPYSINQRTGELKYIHISVGSGHQLMIRLVLRSRDRVADIREALPDFYDLIPNLTVLSANIHPRHEARTEGPDEIILTRETTLPYRVGNVDLELGPQAFAQTNTAVAGQLYRQVTAWALSPIHEGGAPGRLLWDLYCGVGGFALHALAGGIDHVAGVEVSQQAISAARLAARRAGWRRDRADFTSADATEWARERLTAGNVALPDVIVVNPPRRGIGAELAEVIAHSAVPRVVYSSCNPATLAKDLEAMPQLAVIEGRLFDMFPHTAHCEVAVLLERK